MYSVTASIAHGSWSITSRFTASRLTAFRSLASRSTASNWTSKGVWSWPAGLSPNTLNYNFEVHFRVNLISASTCICRLTQLRTPIVSLSSLDLSLQVYLETCSITAYKYVFNEWRQVYCDTGVTEVDSVTGSLYSADHGVHRHHLISISSYHTMKIHTLSFPTFTLTRSVRDFVDPCNCVNHQSRVVS